MAKKRVGVDNLESFICKESGSLHMDGSLILTPGARDELSRRGVAVVYGPRPESGSCAPAAGACPPGCTCAACTAGAGTEASGAERLVLAVAGILKDRYGITDPGQLRTLSCHVVETIRKNI